MRRRPIKSVWELVEVRGPDECWPWTGKLTAYGYGYFRRGGKFILAHREVAGTPDGLDTLHSCDNPPCCNPAHLKPGTKAENNADMVTKGRHAHGEKYADTTEADVRAIYADRLNGMTYAEISTKWGKSLGWLGNLFTGRTWKHLNLPGIPKGWHPKAERRRAQRRQPKPRNHLTSTELEQLREYIARGWSVKQMADKLKRPYSTTFKGVKKIRLGSDL